MKKRLLTLGLAALLFVGALTGILMSISASNEAEFDPDSYNYEALYVDGAVVHYSAMDHKAGDTVDPVLDTTKDGKQLLLSKINSSVSAEWAYGDGYLEISTGAQIQLKEIFAPGDAEDSEKEYTVEYLFGLVDKGVPQTASRYAQAYPKDTLYGSLYMSSYKIASSNFTVHYIPDEALMHLKKLASDYHSCGDSVALQATFQFEPNEEHIGSDSDGIFDYNQTTALIEAYPAYYSFFNMDYTRMGLGRVAKTVYNLGGAWKADFDWKKNAQEIFRMPFGETRKLNFTIKNSIDESGKYTENTNIYTDCTLLHSASHTFAPDKLSTDLLLAKDVGTRVYAVRLYDRVLTADEMQQNHIADLCRTYRLDPSFYTEADEQSKSIYKTALLNVQIGADSKEKVLSLIGEAQSSVLKTEKNEYTALYVQEGLTFMLAPMTTTKDMADGALVTTLTDLDGNFYSVGSSNVPASFTDRAVNLGLMQSLDLGAILPESGTYTVRLLYANHLSPTYTETKSQLTKFKIGSALYRIGYAPPTVDPSAKSGVTRSFLYMIEGATGSTSWKKDFDTVWNSGAKQPDLFAIDYGQIHEFENEFSIGASTINVNIYSDGRAVTVASAGKGVYSPNTVVLGEATNLDIYSVMVYSCALTAEQKMQNHFADLMSYYQVDMAMFERITNANTKKKLYEALKNVKLGETSKEYLQNVLESFALTGGALGVIKAEDYLTFEGIQSRIEDYASARALFSVNNKNLSILEEIGCEVEVGAILMPVTDDNSLEDLTVAYVPSLGEYAPSDESAIQKTFYRKGEVFDGFYGFKTDEKRYFSASIPSLVPQTASEEELNKQYYMRAYLAVDFDGSSFVLYIDAVSELFGDSVSVKEACDYFLFTGYAESDVLGTLAGEYATAAARKTLEISLLAHNKYNIAYFSSKLVRSARDGADEAKAANALASAGISISMSEAEAMRVGPQAATTKVQAELYASIGIAKYEEAFSEIALAREAAEKMYIDVYNEALNAGADEAKAAEVRDIACARLLTLIGNVETNLESVAPLVDEMQLVLDGFESYTALLQLSKVFPSKASVFLNKLPLTRYTIVTDSEHLAVAEALQKLLLAHIGNTIGVYNVDNQYIGSQYDYTNLNTIVLGLTEDQIKKDGSSYAIYGDGNCVFIEGSTFEAVEAASAKFFKSYCGGTGRLQITLDSAKNALLGQDYVPMISFNYGGEYAAVQCDSYDALGVWQVFMQKISELPEEFSVIDIVEPEAIPDSLKNVYYVATNGLDSNSGTIDAPFATLEAALEKVSYVGGATIYVRGGYYELEKPVSINSRHNGTSVSPLYISAYPGEEVVFTSAKKIEPSALQTVDQAIASDLVDAKMKTRLNAFNADNSKNVYVTFLDPTVYNYGTPQETQLYIDGALSHVARWPNQGVEDPTNHITNGRIAFTDKGLPGTLDKKTEDVLKVGKVKTSTSKLYDDHKDDVGGWEIVFDNCLYKDHLLTYDKDVDLYTYAAVYAEWERSHYKLTLSVDDQGRNIMTSDTNCSWGCMEHSGNNMYFYNAIEDLDQNGEFYLDYDTGVIYIYSDKPLTDSEILMSSSAVTLLDVAGASNVVVNGISFTKTMATALSIRDFSDHVIIQRCIFSDIKGNAVALDGRYCGVLACDFSNTTSAMATVSSNLDRLECSYNFVQNCRFHDPNELAQTGLSLGGIGIIVSHNLFADTVVSYQSTYETILEYNEFSRGSQITYDSGPVYLSGCTKKKGNVVRYNYFHDLNISKYGIYLDDLSSGNYVYGNIIHYAEENSGGGKCVNIHSGNMNVVWNNIGFNAETAGILSNINYYVVSIDGKKTGGGGMAYRWEAMSERLKDSGTENQEFADRFPLYAWFSELTKQHLVERELNPAWSDTSDKNSVADALEIFLRSPSFNVCLDNVMINCGAEGYNLADPLKNGLVERNLYFATPEEVGFVDYENYDFNLREDSAVWTQNAQFTRIPFERMGRTID